jgi:AcrR family transcriptional regulator
VTRRGAPPAAARPSPDHDARPLRRDAEVNLGRILVAARDVFAEQGYDAPMETIASRADVGVGTLYRRFPTKADQFKAVVELARQRNLEIAEEVLRDVEPAEAVFEFVRRCISVPSVWRATTVAPPWGPNRGVGLTQIAPLIATIVDRSQEAGSLRADVEVTDIVIVLKAVRSIADLCDRPTAKPSLRFLELALDGLRPGPASPRHPPLRIGQLAAILTQG